MCDAVLDNDNSGVHYIADIERAPMQIGTLQSRSPCPSAITPGTARRQKPKAATFGWSPGHTGACPLRVHCHRCSCRRLVNYAVAAAVATCYCAAAADGDLVRSSWLCTRTDAHCRHRLRTTLPPSLPCHCHRHCQHPRCCCSPLLLHSVLSLRSSFVSLQVEA